MLVARTYAFFGLEALKGTKGEQNGAAARKEVEQELPDLPTLRDGSVLRLSLDDIVRLALNPEGEPSAESFVQMLRRFAAAKVAENLGLPRGAGAPESVIYLMSIHDELLGRLSTLFQKGSLLREGKLEVFVPAALLSPFLKELSEVTKCDSRLEFKQTKLAVVADSPVWDVDSLTSLMRGPTFEGIYVVGRQQRGIGRGPDLRLDLTEALADVLRLSPAVETLDLHHTVECPELRLGKLKSSSIQTLILTGGVPRFFETTFEALSNITTTFPNLRVLGLKSCGLLPSSIESLRFFGMEELDIRNNGLLPVSSILALLERSSTIKKLIFSTTDLAELKQLRSDSLEELQIESSMTDANRSRELRDRKFTGAALFDNCPNLKKIVWISESEGTEAAAGAGMHTVVRPDPAEPPASGACCTVM